MTTVLTTAISALTNGACPIRGMTDGSKRPYGNWSEWQDHRPDRVLVHQWFTGGHPALGIVCGEVSGRLECLEIEGRAMNLWLPLKERMAQAGLWGLLTGIAGGYSEKSPSGGVHFLYRIGGESEMPGNTKLASRVVAGVVQVESMIETRGEGGFIIVAPSNGSTHPSGEPWEMLNGGWDSVTTITRDQRDALIRICESFDESPTLVVPPPSRSRAGTQPREGSGWVETALGDWTHANPIESVLQRNGWQYLESDALGELWRRPGKDRGSCSARVNLNSRLHVFSTSTPFVAGMRRATTYDSLDVELTYRLGRPPSSDERVALLRAETTAAPPTDDWSFVGRAAGTAGVQHHQEGVTPIVAGPNLPDELWNERAYLRQIRDAAHSRLLSPDAVLGAVLARYATTIPTTLMLPAIVGAMGTFDYTTMLVGATGSGKSTAMACAAELLHCERDRLLFDPPIGSGEGLIQAFLELETVEIDGEKVTRQRQILDGVHLSVDEGTVLSAQMRREGTVIAQTLCSAWVGAPLGQLNASSSTKRLIARYEARVTAVMGIQTERGEYLLSGPAAEMGLPQRMVYFSLSDPTMPAPGTVTWPGELDVPILDPNHWSIRHPIKVDSEIVAEIQKHQHGVGTGRTLVEQLDSHRYLAQLKTAGILAFMDGRREISPADWTLARLVVNTSRAVRSTILEAAALNRRKVSDQRVAARVGESLAIGDAARARATDLGARSLARKVFRSDEPLKRKELKDATASQHRAIASVDEMIDYAISRGWVVDNSDGTFGPGDAKPA